MKKKCFYDGSKFTNSKSSEASFTFFVDENKLVIEAPQVKGELLDKETFDAESMNALRGALSWMDDRCALKDANDGTRIKIKYEKPEEVFSIEAPEKCQMSAEDKEIATTKLSTWLEAQEKVYGFDEADDSAEEDTKAEEPKKAEEPAKESEGKAEKPEPAPAQITKLSNDPADWSDDDINAWFDGKAEV